MVIDVVLPCLNEAAALPWVLARMPESFHPIVADNGSTDASASIAADFGATVVRVPQRGFGAACHAGLLTATSEVVCFMDADASLDPGDLPLVADPILAEAADLVLGRRVARGLRAGRCMPGSGTRSSPRSCAAAPACASATWARCGPPAVAAAAPRPHGPPVRLPA